MPHATRISSLSHTLFRDVAISLINLAKRIHLKKLYGSQTNTAITVDCYAPKDWLIFNKKISEDMLGSLLLRKNIEPLGVDLNDEIPVN